MFAIRTTGVLVAYSSQDFPKFSDPTILVPALCEIAKPFYIFRQ